MKRLLSARTLFSKPVSAKTALYTSVVEVIIMGNVYVGFIYFYFKSLGINIIFMASVLLWMAALSILLLVFILIDLAFIRFSFD